MTNKRSVFAINWAEAESLAAGRHDNPHHILGMHESIDGVYINAFFPGAESVTAVSKNSKDKYDLVSERIAGFFTVKIPDKKRGLGVILCLIDKKTYLRENLVALPLKYV